MSGTCSTHGIDEMRTRSKKENLKRRYHFRYAEVDERIILRWILKRSYRKVMIGFIWLKTGISDGLD
jgi:hypothetical protein